MNVFEAVKQSVTTRQAASFYGIRVGRNGMVCCPFHNDRTPSMKVDSRFYCFGCGASGDVIDFAALLYGLGKREAAVRLAEDFGVSYEKSGNASPDRKRHNRSQPRQKSAEQRFDALVDSRLAGKSLIFGAFLSFVNHVNQEIKEKVKSNNRAPMDCFQSLFCRLTRFG